MIGAVIGDIVGSIYEFANIKTKEFPLFSERSKWTDDTILSMATAQWILDGAKTDEVGNYYHRFATDYPNPMGGYGTGFLSWLHAGDMKPYNSCGNGSAMRVGAVGWACNSVEEVLAMARVSAECTHNHPEGIKGAQATALAIMMARLGSTKEEIRDELERRFGYNLRFTCDDIRATYGWGATCQDTVPQAIVAFLDGSDFEDCVRCAISIGGDSDTLGCITGSIAEAYFGVPDELRQHAMNTLPEAFKNIITEFESKYPGK